MCGVHHQGEIVSDLLDKRIAREMTGARIDFASQLTEAEARDSYEFMLEQITRLSTAMNILYPGSAQPGEGAVARAIRLLETNVVASDAMATIRESEVTEETRAAARQLYNAYASNEIDPASLPKSWDELSDIKRSNWCAAAMTIAQGCKPVSISSTVTASSPEEIAASVTEAASEPTPDLKFDASEVTPRLAPKPTQPMLPREPAMPATKQPSPNVTGIAMCDCTTPNPRSGVCSSCGGRV